jgi:hypothetical protein
MTPDDSSDRYWCLCHLFVLEHAVTPGGTRFVIDHHSLVDVVGAIQQLFCPYSG